MPGTRRQKKDMKANTLTKFFVSNEYSDNKFGAHIEVENISCCNGREVLKVDRQVAGNARDKEAKQDMKAKTLPKLSASNK